MRKSSIFAQAIVFIAFLALFCGCRSADVSGYTFPEGAPVPGYEGAFYHPEFTTIEAYDRLLSESYIPEGYVSYYDIAFVGDFCEYVLGVALDVDELHDRAYYILQDPSECKVVVSISKRNFFTPSISRKQDYEDFDASDGFRYAPENPPDVENYEKTYKYDDILLSYASLRTDQGKKLVLKSINWRYGEYYISVLRGDSTVLEWDELGWPTYEIFEYLFSYPEEATDTFVGRLLNPETTLGAIDQLNFVIWWVNFRDGLIKWLPVIIPVACVTVAGTVYVIIHRKRKRAAVKSTVQEGEPNADE